MSRTKSNTSGKVRSVKNSPPGPPFSPSVWRMPYFRGTSQSSFHKTVAVDGRGVDDKAGPVERARRWSFADDQSAPDLVFSSGRVRSFL